MIVQEILTARYDPQAELDSILAKCCEAVLNGQAADPDFYGMVGACVVCPDGSLVYGVNYEAEDGRRVHAERAALERCAEVSPECIVVTTLSPCNRPMDERSGESCEDLIKSYGIEHVYCGYKDPTQDHNDSIETDNPKLHELCKRLADTFLKKGITESQQIASAEQVWDYVDGIHPKDQQGGGFLKSLIMKYPRYELRRIPLSDIHIPDQEYDDEDQDSETDDPYNRAMFVDPEHAGEYSQHYVDKNPIVVDAEGYILDGNHRAWAAAELLNKTDIMAWVPASETQNITESFDQPYPMTWEHGEESHDALVKLPDGTNLSIMFSMDYGAYGDEEWQVEFWRNNSQDVTGEGDAQRIFATVLTAIQQFIKQYSPERIRFSATKENDNGQTNQSRSSLYTKLVKRYANSWGYSVDVSDHSGTVVYELFNDLNEVTLVPTVAKSKRQHLDVMPNDGRPIPRGEESIYMGDLVAEIGKDYQLWSWTDRGTVTYYVYNTVNRICQLATTGRPYKTNRDSFVVQGVYSGPKNKFRAADLYAFLILNQGLTLVSDNKQSAGGYRVWQELEHRYKTINVHGFDTNTNKGVNVTTQDEPDTHVDRATVKTAGPQMKKELGTISRDLRFVASKK